MTSMSRSEQRSPPKAQLVPIYLGAAAEPEFLAQVNRLRDLLGDVATLLPPQALGTVAPDADAALFPELTGDVYRRKAELMKLTAPVLVLTSEFGTMAMWDWELISYLREEGVRLLAPYSLAGALTACRALATRRELRHGKFVVY